MISVVIPTLNAASRLPLCLHALVTPTLRSVVKEVLVVDGGSTDETMAIADGFGAKILTAPKGRGPQLIAGAKEAKGNWLLFLHADTVLEDGWENVVGRFIGDDENRFGVFNLSFATRGVAPKIVAAAANIRTRVLGAPYGDQGLLISRSLYNTVEGYAEIPLFEDVDIVRRLLRLRGRRAMQCFQITATTSAEKYDRRGYVFTVLRNALLLARFYGGASPAKLAKVYR